MNTPITPSTGVVAIASAIVIEAIHGDGSVFALRCADNVNSAAANYEPGLPPSFSLEGKNRHGEAGALERCSTLLEHLRSLGHSCSGLRRLTKNEDNESAFQGIDCVAIVDSERLQMQVTRAVGDEHLRHAFATDGRVSRDYADAGAAAAAIRDSALRKYDDLCNRTPPIDLSKITLVLDSSETLCLVIGSEVVDSFCQTHSEWARGLGFQGIWLVGPAPKYVFLLA